MTLIGKAIKQLAYQLELDGLPVATIQEITPPEVEVEKSAYSAGTYDVKEPGRVSVGDMELTKVMDSLSLEDRWAWLWITQANNFDAPTLVPSTLKRNGRIVLLDANSLPVRIFAFEGAWVCKVSLGTLSKTTSDNVIESVTLSVDKFYEVFI